MPTTYTHTTFAAAKERLAQLLGDPDKVFWTDFELGTYIIEALRWWGLTTQYFRETCTFNTVAGQGLYSLPQVATNTDGDLVQSFTVTDRDVLTDMTYALMEPRITAWGSGWQGTEMFTLGDLTDYVAKGRDDLLRDSGSVLTERTYGVVLGQQRVDLVQSTSNVVRVSVQEVGAAGPLPAWAMDNYQLQGSVSPLPTVGRPKAFAQNYSPWLSLDLFPSPQVPTDVLVYAVESGGTLDPTTVATPLGLPDDACWLVKYRALEDALSGDGLARAPQLAQYSADRVREGLLSMALYQSLLWSAPLGRRLTISPLSQLDLQRPAWQQSTGSPRSLHPLSWNLFAVNPVPDGIYSIQLELVRKAPIPASDTDTIQVGPEWLGALYDYAQHIAMFKSQGQEFSQSYATYQSATLAAMECLAQQAAKAPNLPLQLRQAIADRVARPFANPNTLSTAQQTAAMVNRQI